MFIKLLIQLRVIGLFAIFFNKFFVRSNFVNVAFSSLLFYFTQSFLDFQLLKIFVFFFFSLFPLLFSFLYIFILYTSNKKILSIIETIKKDAKRYKYQYIISLFINDNYLKHFKVFINIIFTRFFIHVSITHFLSIHFFIFFINY